MTTTTATRRRGLDLLDEPTARTLLGSDIPARMAYVWTDGTPRVTPVWFHWTGEHVVTTSLPAAPKLTALARNPRVALAIDTNGWPPNILYLRGPVEIETVHGPVPEFALMARRYLGEEGSREFLARAEDTGQGVAKLTIRPDWVELLDFETRWPSAWSK